MNFHAGHVISERPLKIIVGCEESGRVRDALRRRGHDAWSCDIEPTRADPRWHYQCDLFDLLARDPDWDLGIFHPVCRFLTNSGVKHLYRGMKKENGINPGRWAAMLNGAGFFNALKSLPFPKAFENPIPHCHARKLIGAPTQIVQPWWFGDPFFKATCWWLDRLPPLVPTNRLTPPAPGTEEHKQWSAVHREPPGPDRSRNRSTFFPGMADAVAEQWPLHILGLTAGESHDLSQVVGLIG
jgi:hypothetical protein